ncbi:MAG: hypothetical protein QM504_01380 [Pseudomonadota bacterium]
MEKYYCSHCGNEIEARTANDLANCPVCNAPISFQTDDEVEKEEKSRKFVYYFIGLVIFCFALIYIVPTTLGR